MIAMITVTYNDRYKFKEWCQWYEEYKDDVDLHIIVDNGSEPNYLSQVKSYFTNSIIIERPENGGSTAAYNSGLKVAMGNPDVDAIMFLGNDIRLAKGCIPYLYKYLYSDESLGMVAPVLLKKNTNIIEHAGCFVRDRGLYKGLVRMACRMMKLCQLSERQSYVDYVGGGISLSKRVFYETVGEQDETLFMYGDELDMFYRSKKLGWRQGVTVDAIAWHQHIEAPLTHDPLRLRTQYLQARNHWYIINKNFSRLHADFSAFIRLLVRLSARLRRGTVYIFLTESWKGIMDARAGRMLNSSLWFIADEFKFRK